jgi:hypothetical protein
VTRQPAPQAAIGVFDSAFLPTGISIAVYGQGSIQRQIRDQEDFAAPSRLAMASLLLAGNLAYISARLFGSKILSSIIRLTGSGRRLERFARVNRLIANYSNDVERLLYLNRQPFRHKACNISIDTLA